MRKIVGGAFLTLLAITSSSPALAIEAPRGWGVDIVSYRGIGTVTEFGAKLHAENNVSAVCQTLVRHPQWNWQGGFRRCLNEVLRPDGPNAELLAQRGGPEGIRTTDIVRFPFPVPVEEFEEILERNLVGKLNETRAQIAALETAVAGERASNAELEANVERLARELAGVTEVRDAALSRNVRLEENIASLRDQLAGEQASNERLQSANAALREQLDAARVREADLETQVAELRQENTALRGENAALKGQNELYESSTFWWIIGLSTLMGIVLAAVGIGFLTRKSKKQEPAPAQQRRSAGTQRKKEQSTTSSPSESTPPASAPTGAMPTPAPA